MTPHGQKDSDTPNGTRNTASNGAASQAKTDLGNQLTPPSRTALWVRSELLSALFPQRAPGRGFLCAKWAPRHEMNESK